MNGRNDEREVEDDGFYSVNFDERAYDAEKERLDPPYPFCLTPKVCAGLGSCPRNPCCAD